MRILESLGRGFGPRPSERRMWVGNHRQCSIEGHGYVPNVEKQ